MISLKVGSLTGLSSKLWPWRSPFARHGQALTAPQGAPRPARTAPPAVSRAVRARASPSTLRPKLVLASASPRRLALLEQAGITPDALRPTTIDESVTKGEVPRHIVKRLARAKAEAAKKLIRGEKEYEKAFVLAADTVVAVGRRVLGKAELEHEAGDALRMLRGRAHRVHTAICLITPDGRIRERVVETRLRFRNLSNEEIGNYLASGEWKGKAGGYAIQGIAGSFVVKLVGSYTNIVGLPLTEAVNLLQGEGFPVSDLWLSKAEVETSCAAAPEVETRSRQRRAKRRRPAPAAANGKRRLFALSARRLAPISSGRAGSAGATPAPERRPHRTGTRMRTERRRTAAARRQSAALDRDRAISYKPTAEKRGPASANCG